MALPVSVPFTFGSTTTQNLLGNLDTNFSTAYTAVNGIANGTNTLSSAVATATGSTTARTLGDRAADIVNVKDFGAVGDGVTNDTTAFRAALAALAGMGGGTLLVPAGHYILSSAFNTANGQNSLLPLPYLVPGTNTHIPIRIVGAGAVSAFGPPNPNSGTVISTPNAGTTTNGIASSIIGFGSSTIAVSAWTAITLQIENIAFKVPANGGVVGVDAYACANCIFENVSVVPDVTPGTESVPTNQNTIGIKLPACGNYGIVKARNVYVTGQYHGIWHSEHADLEVLINLCFAALYIPANYSHLAKYKVTTQACSYSVWCDAVLNALQCTSVWGELDIERDPNFPFQADFQVSAGCQLNGALNYNVAADPGSLVSVFGAGSFNVLMQNIARMQSIVTASATVNCNGWFFPVIPNALTAPITITVKTENPGYIVGQRLRIYGYYAYAVTIQSDVTSGDPKFYLTDGSSTYTLTLPPGGGSNVYAELLWDGLDWRVTFSPGYVRVLTFANLPTAPTEGTSCIITDSSTATFYAMPTGGSTLHVNVRFLGGVWRVC